ncbi:MAG: fimbria/pilus outer membrane usher protein, partial [Thermoanaerobaculia bacterium]
SSSADRPTLEASAHAGFQAGSLGSFSLQYSRLAYRDRDSSNRLTASVSTRVGQRATVFLSGSLARGGGASNEAFVGVSYSLGSATSANLSFHDQDGGSSLSLDAQRSLPAGSGFGYRMHASTGSTDSVSGRVQLQGPVGSYEASYDRVGSTSAGSLTVSGGLVAIDGTVALSRRVQDGFALIRVPGVGGVRGFSSNQIVGRTNRKGELLVTDLLPYYGNVLGIADEDVPLGYEVGAVQKLIAPPYRGGAVVSFAVQRFQAFRGALHLIFHDGAVVPVNGSLRVTAEGRDFESSIGSNGGFYLENVPSGSHPAQVLYRGVVCDMTIVLPPSPDPIVKLAELECAAGTARPLTARTPALLTDSTGPLRVPLLKLTHDGAAPPKPDLSAATVTAPRVSVRHADFRPASFVSPDWAGKKPAYVIQFSSYRTRRAAEREAATLSGRAGRRGFVVSVDLGARGTWYRAVLGGFETAQEALGYRATLLETSPEIGFVYQITGSKMESST